MFCVRAAPRPSKAAFRLAAAPATTHPSSVRSNSCLKPRSSALVGEGGSTLVPSIHQLIALTLLCRPDRSGPHCVQSGWREFSVAKRWCANVRIGELAAAVHDERVGAATCANAPPVTVAWLHPLMSSECAAPTQVCKSRCHTAGGGACGAAARRGGGELTARAQGTVGGSQRGARRGGAASGE